jgi:hypothetical protein
MSTYWEKLHDPRWWAFSDRIIAERENKCQECGNGRDGGAPLQVHHVDYIRGREPWDYPDELVLCLCRTCHRERQIHDEECKFEFARLLGQLKSWDVYELSKGIRAHNNRGEYKHKLFDAFAAITRQDNK